MAYNLNQIKLENSTDSDLYIADLSGLYIPASGTVDVTELFPFKRLCDSQDLDELITNSGIVLEVEGIDLSAYDGITYLNHKDATHIVGKKVGDGSDYAGVTDYGDGKYIKFNSGTDSFQLKGVNFTELEDVNIDQDGTYTISGTAGAAVPAMSFLDLTDTPVTYSGVSGYGVTVNGTGDGLVLQAAVNASIISSPTPPASGVTNVWYNTSDNAFYYYDDERVDWLGVTTHMFLFTYNASISSAYMSVGNIGNDFAHFNVARPATITAISAHGGSGNATKGFDVTNTVSGVESDIKTFYMTDYEYNNQAENIYLTNGSDLRIFVHSTGQGIKYPIIQLEVKWRYEA